MQWTRRALRRDPDGFLRRSSGVIHVGANVGQERELYGRLGLRVIWIEPVPEVFKTLVVNLQSYPRQAAFQYLVTDQDDVEYTFHVSTNDAESSSILELNLHRDIWPEVSYCRTMTLQGTTLASLLQRERIAIGDYDALVMDTQGSELLVLRGADPVLQSFRFIKTEVADFDSYVGCCQLRDIDAFVTERGFKEISRRRFAERAEGGSYYNVVYAKRAERGLRRPARRLGLPL